MNTESKEQGIKEGNKIIAGFMNVRYYQNDNITAGLVKYHTSWDWLMPVVEEINKLDKYDVIIYRTTCHINDEREILIETTFKKTLIECVWEAVVQFINWYNQNK